MEQLIDITTVSKLLSVSISQLRRWDKSGYLPAIHTPGGWRKYKASTIEAFQGNITPGNSNLTAAYARVSSHHQAETGDLKRQSTRISEYCKSKNYNVITVLEEIGSGLNDNRPKLKSLLNLIINHKINLIVVEHKDRLTRYNYNSYKSLIAGYGCTIEYIEEDLPKSFEAELVSDITSLMLSFSARLYGQPQE